MRRIWIAILVFNHLSDELNLRSECIDHGEGPAALCIRPVTSLGHQVWRRVF